MSNSQDILGARACIAEHLDKLIQHLHSDNPKERAEAVSALGGIDWVEMLEAIQDALNDPNVEVRLQALEACVNLQMTSSLPLIEERFLEDESEIIRGRAAICIALLAFKPKRKLLMKGTEDTSASIQLTSWVALYLTSADNALESIYSFLSHEDPKLRLATVELLTLFCSQKDKEDVLDVLSQQFQSESDVNVSDALQKAMMELGG